MRVAIVDPFVSAVEIRRRVRTSHEIVTLSDATVADDAEVVVTAIEPLSAKGATRWPRLREVISASTGLDHIDVEGLTARDVTVTSVPDYCTDEVSDHAVAQTCALLRSLPEFIAEPVAAWQSPKGIGVRRFSSAHIGVLGTGRIGRAICAKLAALGMRVSVSQRPSSPRRATSVPGAEVRDLEAMLPEVDVLVIAAAADTGGEVILDSARLALLRPDAFLVNVARASLVDIDAMRSLLQTRRLAGAFFDVWSSEPPTDFDVIADTPGLYLSPHSAWYSPEAVEALWNAVAARLDALNGTAAGIPRAGSV